MDLGWREQALTCLASFKKSHPEHRRAKHLMEMEHELETGEGLEEEGKGRQRQGLPRGLGAYTAASFLRGAEEEDEDEGMETEEMEPGVRKWPAQEVTLRKEARDYSARFLGACNTTTDIKEANFLGSSGRFIMAGSDDGKFFIWDRK